MKWSVPYVKGGLADQSVMLLRCIDVINRVKSQYEAEEQKRRENKSNASMGSGRGPKGKGGQRLAGH